MIWSDSIFFDSESDIGCIFHLFLKANIKLYLRWMKIWYWIACLTTTIKLSYGNGMKAQIRDGILKKFSTISLDSLTLWIPKSLLLIQAQTTAEWKLNADCLPKLNNKFGRSIPFMTNSTNKSSSFLSEVAQGGWWTFVRGKLKMAKE